MKPGSSIRNKISKSRACDKKCDCLQCYDEWRCNGYRYHYWYRCYNFSTYIPSHYICDNNTDCYHGDDERNCGNVTTCVQESISPSTYIIANYSRCTPRVMCANKLDQSNCSDTKLAPLQCPINGYVSNVSQHIIRKRTITVNHNVFTVTLLLHLTTVWMCSALHHHLAVTFTSISSVATSPIVKEVLMRKVLYVSKSLHTNVKESSTIKHH